MAEGNEDRAIYPSLRGKKVLITGGASGIGAGIVEAFARQDCDVSFIDILNGESDAHAAKTGAMFERIDLTDTAATARCIARLIDAQCIDRRLVPEDVAALVIFLASDDARGMTGHEYFVDAGWR